MATITRKAAAPKPHKGMPGTELAKADFTQRYQSQFHDPAFYVVRHELDRITGIAFDNYCKGNKSPVTSKAGRGFFDPDYELSSDWRAASDTIAAAQTRYDDTDLPSRILLVNGSSRSDQTCPGKMSKSYRMVELARKVLEDEFSVVVDVLDLSRLSSEYGRKIHPCKACF